MAHPTTTTDRRRRTRRVGVRDIVPLRAANVPTLLLTVTAMTIPVRLPKNEEARTDHAADRATAITTQIHIAARTETDRPRIRSI